jgi:hypothetical protein
MSLTAGTKFCPYEIQSPLGAGGTGERQYENIVTFPAISSISCLGISSFREWIAVQNRCEKPHVRE